MFHGNQALAFLQLCYCNPLAASSFRHSHTFEIGDPVFEIEIVFVSNNHEMTTGHLLLCTVIVALLQ